MKLPQLFLTLLFVWILIFSVNAASSSDKLNLSIQDHSFDTTLAIGNGLLFLEDTARRFSIQSILDQHFTETFQITDTRGIFWLKFKIGNQTRRDRQIVLKHYRLNQLKVFLIDHNGDLVAFKNMGEYAPKSLLNNEEHRKYASLVLSPNSSFTVFIRFEHTRDRLWHPTIEVSDVKSFMQKELLSSRIYFILIGACLIMVIYSFILYFIHKFTPYLWLGIFAFFYSLCTAGYHVEFLLQESTFFAQLLDSPVGQMAHMSMIIMAMLFYNLKSKNPFWYRVFQVLLFLGLIRVLIVIFFSAYYQAFYAMMLLALISMLIDGIFMSFMVIKNWSQYDLSDKVFGIGLNVFVIIIILTSVAWTLISNGRDFVILLGFFGSISQVLFFAVALGIRMRQHEIDKNRILDEMNSMLKVQNQKIKEEVNKQTEEIRNQKTQLETRNSKIEILYKEIHHRVKNNLQLISSLLSSQQEWDENDYKKVIDDSNSRVIAMSMIHEYLYTSENINSIEIDRYVRDLISRIGNMMSQNTQYEMDVSIATGYRLDLDTSIPLGLILNELITNSFKHNQNLSNIKIEISQHEGENQQQHIQYRDNGKKIPLEWEQMTRKSYGLRISARLAQQLEGELSYEYHDGNVFCIAFYKTDQRIKIKDQDI